jgi:hypothetical protein
MINEEYVIEKVSDILKIPEPKFKKFLAEFTAGIHSAYYTAQVYNELAKKMKVKSEMEMPVVGQFEFDTPIIANA